MNRTFLIIAGAAVLSIALGIALYPKPAASPEDSGATPAASGPGSGMSSGGSGPAGPTGSTDAAINTRVGPSNKQEPPQHKAPAPPAYPTAKALPDREGFVLSPYNNKIVDVRGIHSGALVADPTYPTDEKKFFRVP